MLVVGKPARLRGQRPRHRSLAGATGENHLLSFRIWNGLWIETRQRDDHRARIGIHGYFVRLADVDQKKAPVGHSLRYFLRRQILNPMPLIRHSILLTPRIQLALTPIVAPVATLWFNVRYKQIPQALTPRPAFHGQRHLSRNENQARTTDRRPRWLPGFRLRPPVRSESGN